MSQPENIERQAVNCIRFLAVDAVEKAKSGHPGMPLGAAAAAYVLFARHLSHNPASPDWFNRDRFVLSAGHASMLLYSLLHLTGYNLPLAELQNFRQWGSHTPGHPERDPARGVEITTGPLGQGIAHAVGMALAERHLAARFNRDGFPLVDHFTYVMASDGDLMEGVSYEACALAGHLGLSRLIVLYDDNRISLAGATALSCSEDVAMRFVACGWQVQHVADGEDLEALDTALTRARQDLERPSLIVIRTTIGLGAPGKQGTHEAHGSPLGAEETAGAKRYFHWPEDKPFHIPPEVKRHFREKAKRGARLAEAWEEMFKAYEQNSPDLAAEFTRRRAALLVPSWDEGLTFYPDGSKDTATRKASEKTLVELSTRLPELVGGSADINPSTFTWLKGEGDFLRPGQGGENLLGALGGPATYEGRNIHFGVREHAMAAIASGMTIHGGIIPFISTFLTFSDYMRPSIRLAALMGLRVIYVFTHDSIGLGEDGPTHQPVEQVMSLRSIPNLTVIRPACANETVAAWKAAIANDRGPTALILTRQNLPVLAREKLASADELACGAYIMWESGKRLELILIATGSEVHLTLAAARELAAEGIGVRLVSLPSWELFAGQTEEYKRQVFPEQVRARLAVEAGIKLGWERFTGLDGAIIGMEGFGKSAPGPLLMEKFGFTATDVARQARMLIRKG